MLLFNRTLSTRFLPVVNKSIFSIGATTKTLQRFLSALSSEGSGNGSSVKSEASTDKARGDEAKSRLSSVGGGNGSSVKSEATAGNVTGGEFKYRVSPYAEKAKTSAPAVQFPSTISDQHSVGEIGRILDELSADMKNLCLEWFDMLGVNEDNAKQMSVAEIKALDVNKRLIIT